MNDVQQRDENARVLWRAYKVGLLLTALTMGTTVGMVIWILATCMVDEALLGMGAVVFVLFVQYFIQNRIQAWLRDNKKVLLGEEE